MSSPDVGTVAEMFSGLYEVVTPMAWNGLALTYDARKPDGERVVLAVLPIDAQSSPEAARLFEVRARALVGLEHPRLVTLRHYGIRHGVPYLELAWADAETLDHVVERGPLDTDRALTIARRILQTLELLEAVGIRHLDLTPRNVLIASEDDVRVVGAGIAAILREVRDSDKTGPTGKGSGPSPGRFLAPELLVGDKADQRTDIYSVGALLHYMTTGRPMGKGGPPPPEDVVPLIAGATSQILSDRYPRASVMRAAIEAAGGTPTIVPPPRAPSDAPVSARPPEEPAPAPSRGPLIALVVVTVLVAVGVGYMATQRQTHAGAGASDTETGDGSATPSGSVTTATASGTRADSGAASSATGDDSPAPSPSAREATGTETDDRDLLAAGPLPEPLDTLWPRVRDGEELSRSDRHLVARYIYEHRDDARPHLLLARDFMTQHWSSDAISAYLAAFAADPECRADTTMRSDLIALSARAASNQDAMRALARIYGRDALPFVEEALGDESLEPGERQRLERLRHHLSSL